MNVDDVEKLILLMQRYELNELALKEEKWEFSARRGDKPSTQPQVQYFHTQAAPAAAGSSANLPSPAASGILPVPPSVGANQKEITSPIVGTFYRAPAPDQPVFIEVGARVSADDVVCIVEAMKVMNEIKAGVNGVIRKILVENATSVEYGQPMFLVEVG
jgi:acetyl-CoA carboxylase biotin carboxyl carrier protein